MKSLKEIVNEIVFSKPKEVKFAEAALATGETIEAESFDAGNPVFLRTSEGDLIPLPEGEYELSDGSRIMVDAEGVIAEFSPSGSGEEEMKQDATEAAEMSKETDSEEKVEFATEDSVKTMIESLRTEVLGAVEVLAGQINAQPKESATVEMSEKSKAEIESLKKKLHKPEALEANEEKSSFKLQERNVERKFVNPVLARVRENLANFNSRV